MQPIFLRNLNPARIDPGDLVNREEVLGWLRDLLRTWLRSPAPVVGEAFCVLGDKGIGKSILTQRVFSDLSNDHSATTVFLTVDCRPLRSQRDVYREAGTQLVAQLAFRQGVPEALLAEARSFDALTRFDTVSLRYAHEQLTQFKASLDLGGSQSLASWLDAKLGISLSRSAKSIDKLEGSITIDGARVREAFVQLLHDIARHTQLRVVLHLDNVEELAHEALLDDARREQVRGEVEALLHLAEAPLALVLNMRTYYSGVLTRRIIRRETLGPLTAEDQRAIFARRLDGEPPSDHARRARETAEVGEAIRRLAELARTPLAFLTWADFVLSKGSYDEADLAQALERRLGSHYATIATHVPAIAALFEGPDARVSAEAILAACAGSDTLYRQLIKHQVVLPHDYWDPREFYLDPELGCMLAPTGAPTPEPTPA